MAKETKVSDEKDLEYYKTAALFWETYAKNIEAELAKQGKKKLILEPFPKFNSVYAYDF